MECASSSVVLHYIGSIKGVNLTALDRSYSLLSTVVMSTEPVLGLPVVGWSTTIPAVPSSVRTSRVQVLGTVAIRATFRASAALLTLLLWPSGVARRGGVLDIGKDQKLVHPRILVMQLTKSLAGVPPPSTNTHRIELNYRQLFELWL